MILKLLFLCWVAGAASKPSEMGGSVSYSTLGPLDISPTGFPSRYSGGFSLQCRSQVTRCLIGGTNLVIIWEKHLSSEFPPYYLLHVLQYEGWVFCFVFTRLCLCFSYPSLLSSVVESASPSSQIFFRGKWSIWSNRFGVSMGGESSYTVILDPSASIHYLLKQYGSAAHLHNL